MNKTWNDRYSASNFYYGTEPSLFLMENISRLKASSKVLCLAEGEGRNAVFVAKHGHSVSAVDFSKVGLENLKKLATQNSVTIATDVADLDEYDLGIEKWDCIISIWCHLPSRIRSGLHRRVGMSLRKGGLFLIQSYTPDQIELATGGPKDPDMLPTAELLRRELLPLHFDTLIESKRLIHEGVGHNGLSAVVEGIAIKE